MKKSHSFILIGVLFFLSIPCAASANAGVPMIFLTMPALGISLIPIIIIEAIFLKRKLLLSSVVAAKTAVLSNLVSTIIGVPLTWLILVLIQMVTGGGGAYGINTTLGKILAVTWQAPWLIPYESDLFWMVPAAGTVLLVPFFFVSWFSEYFVSKKILRTIEPRNIKNQVRNANLITYSMLIIWPISMLIWPN